MEKERNETMELQCTASMTGLDRATTAGAEEAEIQYDTAEQVKAQNVQAESQAETDTQEPTDTETRGFAETEAKEHAETEAPEHTKTVANGCVAKDWDTTDKTGKLERLLAEAEEKGYRRGRNESIDKLMKGGVNLQQSYPTETTSEATEEIPILNHIRKPWWGTGR